MLNTLTDVQLSLFFSAHIGHSCRPLCVWMGLCNYFMSMNVCVDDIYDFKTNAVKSICAFPKLFSLLTSAVLEAKMLETQDGRIQGSWIIEHSCISSSIRTLDGNFEKLLHLAPEIWGVLVMVDILLWPKQSYRM